MTSSRTPFQCVLLASLALAIVAGAAEYHVATNGSDAATGTQNTPFKTIQRAADVMQPGDVCVVHAGSSRDGARPAAGPLKTVRRGVNIIRIRPGTPSL